MMIRKRRTCCTLQRPGKKVCADPPAARRRRCTTNLFTNIPGLYLLPPASDPASSPQPLTQWPAQHVLALILVGPGPDAHVEEAVQICAGHPWLRPHVAIVRYCRPEKVQAQINSYKEIALVLDTSGALIAAVGARDPLGGGCHALNSIAVIRNGRPEQLYLGYDLDIKGILFKLVQLHI